MCDTVASLDVRRFRVVSRQLNEWWAVELAAGVLAACITTDWGPMPSNHVLEQLAGWKGAPA